MAKIVPELNYLLAEVEKRYGRRLSTSADFEALSVVVEHESGELISASTLKRLWGYVTYPEDVHPQCAVKIHRETGLQRVQAKHNK